MRMVTLTEVECDLYELARRDSVVGFPGGSNRHLHSVFRALLPGTCFEHSDRNDPQFGRHDATTAGPPATTFALN